MIAKIPRTPFFVFGTTIYRRFEIIELEISGLILEKRQYEKKILLKIGQFPTVHNTAALNQNRNNPNKKAKDLKNIHATLFGETKINHKLKKMLQYMFMCTLHMRT